MISIYTHMTKAEELIENIGDVRIGTTGHTILEHVKNNKDEVFTREELLEVVPDVKQRTVDHYAQRLVRDELIGKVRFNGKTYYGNKEIIDKIRTSKIEDPTADSDGADPLIKIMQNDAKKIGDGR